MSEVTVIGAGLAGCEAAMQLARRSIKVRLVEMKPKKLSPAHKSPLFAELVCSNSLKASRVDSAAGLLKAEMRKFGSVCLNSADNASVAAGGALAVDREKFAAGVTDAVKANPNITVEETEAEDIPQDGVCIIATGPLTAGRLAEKISALSENGCLSFYDAAAPIVTAESIDFSKAFYASRYGENDGTGDYINCPFNKAEYESFYEALINAEGAVLHEFDRPLTVYEGCMPIEVLAKRGNDSIRFGPMKPVGLRDPRTGHRPWAAVQLRRENSAATLFNIVGFQTNLKFGEQKRVFSMIPGLENAEFARYGVMHRNTFIDSPRLLSKHLSLKNNPNIFFAGQITGVEGYMESAACGIVAGINAARLIAGHPPLCLPEFTMTGAILSYITDCQVKEFQPMGANFGILPPLEEKIRDKRERYGALAERSLRWFDENINECSGERI